MVVGLEVALVPQGGMMMRQLEVTIMGWSLALEGYPMEGE